MITLLSTCAFNNNLHSQTIVIDSTFTADAVLHPFGQNDTLYSLKISGNIQLNTDTSLVRVVVGNEDSLEYMMFEYYPMIADSAYYSFSGECDETAYLNGFIPEYLKIFISEATLQLSSISDSATWQENLDSLQYTSKQNKDLEKIDNMNAYINERGWNWFAYSTPKVEQYYYQKKHTFREGYNLLGIDYYLGGTYNSVIIEQIPPTDETTELISSFDWREKHNADIEGSLYWDGELNEKNNGWMTNIRDQHGCNSCSAFGSIGAFEAYINLFFNFHSDIINGLELSERDAFNCSKYFGIAVGCSCDNGKYIDDILDYIQGTGVVNEECYEYTSDPDSLCEGSPPELDCSFASKCSEPPYIVKLDDYNVYDLDDPAIVNKGEFIKRKLIEEGPLIIEVGKLFNSSMSHCVVLTGYRIEDGITVWIMKNSWGYKAWIPPIPPNWPFYNDQGYVTAKLLLGTNHNYPCIYDTFYSLGSPNMIQTPIVQPPGYEEYYIHTYDKDKDGYWNWGFEMPEGWEPPCNTSADWNDNNNRTGPCDDNFNGQYVQPEMGVYQYHPINGIKMIENNGFCSFTSSDLNANGELTIRIFNTGDAQLNFASNPDPVIELSDEGNCFELDMNGLDTSPNICNLTNYKDIKISYDINCPISEDGFNKATYLIDIHQDDEDVVDDFEFTLVYFDCTLDQDPERIDEYTLWEDYIVKNHDIYIQNGGALEITGLVGMAPGTNIFVETGGQLLLNGGKITNVCDAFWEGIDVWGSTYLSQYPFSNQGYVRITNGGTIAHADHGIQVAKIVNGEGVYGTMGGIVKCDSALFLNNNTDVSFYSYTNFNPYTQADVPNASYFKNTSFINDEICIKEKYVSLNTVDGIKFKGCSFTNNVTQADCQSQHIKGNGIYSFNAGFYVQGYCRNNTYPCTNPIPCSFSSLEHGIYALNAEFNEIIDIDNAIFKNNKTGIYMSLVSQQSITRNSFVLDENHDLSGYGDEIVIGANLEYCQNFTIEENDFLNASNLIETGGLQILNAGPHHNEIYNNSFNGHKAGIIAAGENRNGSEEGLCLRCNDFSNCNTDIYVIPDGGTIQDYLGIAFQQGIANGQPDGPAGNTFTDDEEYPLLEYHFNNATDNSINYAHHLNQGDKILEPTEINNINPIQDDDAPYSREESCPSNFPGSLKIGNEMNALSYEYMQLSAIEDTLSMEVDGGDTEELNLDVLTTMPNQALQTTQELQSESPYLSDTVMESNIYKENIFPNAMVRDVLVANPQSAKSGRILQALDQRQDPMPDYMMSEIMQGRQILGAKELLEQRKTKHSIAKTKSFNKLWRHYLTDTLGTALPDSILWLLSNERSLHAKYQKAFIFLENDDTIRLQNVLDSIPIEFSLSNRENTAYNLYCDLFDILVGLYSDTTGIDSTREIQLFEIEQYSNHMPGIYARNILLNNGSINYDEPVYLPSGLKSQQHWENQQNSPEVKDTFIKVFPNPAGNYIIIEYDLVDLRRESFITFCDGQGRMIDQFKPVGLKNQQVIDTGELSSGLYLVQLYADNKLIETHKIEIVK